MSILIKGAEMPTDCNRCPIDYHYRICNGHKERCSIVEVPVPHGRLIDADACRQKVYDGSRTPYKTCPTVIEAEDN